MLRIIKKSAGAVLFIFGAVGFIIEISSFFTENAPDTFGLALSLALLIGGGLLFWSGRKKSPPAHPDGEAPSKSPLKIIGVIGIILSWLTVIGALGFLIYGAIISTALFSGVEPGWGILGIGMVLMGFAVLVYGLIRLAGYRRLKRYMRSGYLIVLAAELVGTLFKTYLIIDGFAVLAAIPLAWSLFVVIYLLKHKTEFKIQDLPNPGK